MVNRDEVQAKLSPGENPNEPQSKTNEVKPEFNHEDVSHSR
jgi:hypothetical protein